MSASVRSSAGLVWRHQRLLWWLFAVNLALAWLSSLTVRATLSTVLDHSLESAKLVTGFDFGTLGMLVERPEVPRALMVGPLVSAVLFLLAMLIFDGGVILEFLEDRKLSVEEFSGCCGGFFWRMARLMMVSLVPFGALAAASGALGDWADRLSSDAPQERLGFFVSVGGRLLIVLLALLARMWFDVAQTRIVHDNERGVLRELLHSLVPALRSGLYAQYVGIGVVSAAGFAFGVWVWLNLPHRAMGASSIVLELVTISQIAARLWMRAASARWVALSPEDMWIAAPPEDELAPVTAGEEDAQPE